MNIGIVTFHGADNYGSVLQAFALSKYIMGLGHSTEIIDYRYIDDYRQYDLFRTYAYKHQPMSIITDIVSLPMHIRRRRNFANFRRRFLPISNRPFFSFEDLEKTNHTYDAIICGSDQIWNPSIVNSAGGAFFLSFVKEPTKKISYAASTGKDILSYEEILDILNATSEFDAVSVREKSTESALQPYTSKPIVCVLDPTFLLDISEYKNIEQSEKSPFHDKYVLVYLLGSTRAYYSMIQYGEQLAQEKHWKLIYIIDTKNSFDRINGVNKSGCSPTEFLRLIHNAQLIVSNSFHATVFSILYQKLFVSFSRNNSSSRMLDLLKDLGLEGRVFTSDINPFEPIDYKQVMEKMQNSIMSSKAFLTRALTQT